MLSKVPNHLVLTVAAVLFLATLVVSRNAAARFFFEQGVEAKKQWRLDKAIRYFDWSARFDHDKSQALLEKGICYQLCGEFLASEREFRSLIAGSLRDPLSEAKLLNASGVNHFNMNEADRAIELHNRSLDLAKELGDARLQAQALIDLSRVLYFTKGMGDQSLDHLRRALQLGRELGDRQIEADALRNIGVMYWWYRAERDRPLNEYYLPALEIYRALGDQRSIAITLSNIGLVYRGKGDWFEFLKRQNDSLAIKERIGDIAGIIDSYSYIGGMYCAMENYRKAREFELKAIELSRETGYSLAQYQAEGELAVIYLKLGDFDNAIEAFSRLLDENQADPMLAKYQYGGLGTCYEFKGDPATARYYLEQGIEANRKAGAESEALVLTALGNTFMDSGDWQKAGECLAKAEGMVFQGTEKYWGELLQNRLSLARFMEHEGRRDDALKYLLEAAEIESQTFGSTRTELVQGQDWRVYDRLFPFLLEPQPGNASRRASGPRAEDRLAFRFLEQLKYRTFRNFVVRLSDGPVAPPPTEKEKAAVARIQRASRISGKAASSGLTQELRRAYSDYEDLALQSQLDQPRYEFVRETRPADLDEVQRALGPETALIEYLYAADRAYALVITRSTLTSAVLPITPSSLATKVKLLRALIFNGAESRSASFDSESKLQAGDEADDAGWQPVAEDLRCRLVEPLERSGALSGIHRLGLIPFGFLHDLPFAALARRQGEQVRFLLEDYGIFYAPSASFLKPLPAHNAPSDGTMISFGRNESDRDGLQPLGFAAKEARSVAQILRGQVRVNTEATETELKQLAPHFRFIHLATHAVSEPMMPLLSRLEFQSTAQDDGNLTAREILDLDLHAELVTLGACRTAESFSASGNEFSEVGRIGLIEAFLHSGARSVLASLLPIEDRSSMEFMNGFYERLRTTKKAEALAETQRAMLKGEIYFVDNNQTHYLTHPRYWAPFILVGDYR